MISITKEKRLTALNFGDICKINKNTSCQKKRTTYFTKHTQRINK